jgi:hypothetical protein
VGTEGNELENRFRDYGFFETNVSAHKLTAVREGIGLEFRAEIFNLFNHPNLQGPNVDPTSGAAFGTAGSQNEQRWIQLGANVKF